MKKNQSKVAQNRPPTFFMFWPCCPNDQETEILYHQKPLTAGLGMSDGFLLAIISIGCNVFGPFQSWEA